jgi:hypothetical protein
MEKLARLSTKLAIGMTALWVMAFAVVAYHTRGTENFRDAVQFGLFGAGLFIFSVAIYLLVRPRTAK